MCSVSNIKPIDFLLKLAAYCIVRGEKLGALRTFNYFSAAVYGMDRRMDQRLGFTWYNHNGLSAYLLVWSGLDTLYIDIYTVIAYWQ